MGDYKWVVFTKRDDVCMVCVCVCVCIYKSMLFPSSFPHPHHWIGSFSCWMNPSFACPCLDPSCDIHVVPSQPCHRHHKRAHLASKYHACCQAPCCKRIHVQYHPRCPSIHDRVAGFVVQSIVYI